MRRFATATFGVACLHLVFGAIVRISGSGMGCGDHWPKCYGRWFPPLSRPDLIIEVSHRYLASVLLLALIATFVAAWRRRGEAGVGGRGGVLRMAGLGVALGFSAALLGALTVKLGNAPFATLAHWTVAMSLVAATVATLIRAGGLGGATASSAACRIGTQRGALAGAAMALITVVMGGLTAKYPGAAVACQGFPLCGAQRRRAAGGGARAAHAPRAGVPRRAAPGRTRVGNLRGAVRRSSCGVRSRSRSRSACSSSSSRAAMVLGHLPPVLRSLHEATGVSIWIATFTLAYLARIGSGSAATVAAAVIRAQSRDLHAPGTPRRAGTRIPRSRTARCDA